MRRPRRAASAGKERKHAFVLAGLPKAALEDTLAALRGRFPAAAFFGSPSRHQDFALYSDGVVDKLLAEVAAFAVRRRQKARPNATWPQSITLLYVPSGDQERLLSAFDFAVMPAPMYALASYGETGQLHRHDPKAATAAAVAAMGPASEAKTALDEVKQRLSRLLNDSEVLFLPPNNFHLEDGRLRTLFDAYRRHDLLPEDRFAKLEVTRLTRDDIPRLGDAVRRAHVDARGNAFLNAHPEAYDGGIWEIGEGDASGAKLAATLKSLYRFGGALPDGFHHDVQPSDGSAYKNTSFDCSRDGVRLVTGPYVNIYPDDFVRPGGGGKGRR